MVSITGSSRAGREVMAAAAPTTKRLHLELGGKAPAVVFADADLPATVRGLAMGVTYNSGQDCTACTRIYVERSAYDELVAGLGEQLGHLPGPSGVQFGEALTALLVAAISETTPDRVDTAVELADRITVYALANLADPGLCVESVARRFAISPRTLHRLFADRHDTFATWLREERLQRVRRDLLDPSLARYTVAAIAARWGLYDAAHLSRLVKTRFGQTPAQLRRLSVGARVLERGSPAPASSGTRRM